VQRDKLMHDANPSELAGAASSSTSFEFFSQARRRMTGARR
jgi:hypothetical protein